MPWASPKQPSQSGLNLSPALDCEPWGQGRGPSPHRGDSRVIQCWAGHRTDILWNE